MRDYGKVSPQFWVGKTGKRLRGDMEAQIVALYLMTSPHANMIGVFYCPVDYIAKETGIPIEGASKALARLSEADFCTFDAESEYVFVHRFAANQIGEDLKPADKRVQGVINELAKVPKGQCWQAFRARYAVPYHLPIEGVLSKPPASPSEAPSKPEAEAEAEAEVVRTKALPIPGVPPRLLADYLEVRKGKRAGEITQTVIDGLEREASKAGISVAEAVQACCEFGWQGFNAGWYADRVKTTGRPVGNAMAGAL